jgi:hypothetical protein
MELSATKFYCGLNNALPIFVLQTLPVLKLTARRYSTVRRRKKNSMVMFTPWTSTYQLRCSKSSAMRGPEFVCGLSQCGGMHVHDELVHDQLAKRMACVALDQTPGSHVTRFVIAHDCGPIANPDALRYQIEGGICGL